MIEKTYQDFKQLYQTELQPREFDIDEVEGGILVARYKGRFLLREQDEDLEVRIEKEGELWKLTAKNAFYCNRAHFSLGKSIQKMVGRSTGGSPLYRYVKPFWVAALKEGKISKSSDPLMIMQPYSDKDIETQMAKSCVRKRLEKNFEVTFGGFSSEEIKRFSLPLNH